MKTIHENRHIKGLSILTPPKSRRFSDKMKNVSDKISDKFFLVSTPFLCYTRPIIKERNRYMFTYLANCLGSFDPYDGLYLITIGLLISLLLLTLYRKRKYPFDKPSLLYTVVNSITVVSLVGLLLMAQDGHHTLLKPHYKLTTQKTSNWRNVYEKGTSDVYVQTAGNKTAPTITLKSYTGRQHDQLNVPIAKKTQTLLFLKGKAKKEVTVINPIITKTYETKDMKNATPRVDRVDIADENVKITSHHLTQVAIAKTAKIHVTFVDKKQKEELPQSNDSTEKNQDMLNRLIASGNPFYTIK